MTEIADRAFAGTRRPALARPVRGRRRMVLSWFLLAGLLALAGPAAAAPVAVGFGFGLDVPGVAAASELSIERGDPLGLALTLPVLVGRFRFEPQVAWTTLGGSYGVPAAPPRSCPGMAYCEGVPPDENLRATLGLAVGPTWSIGEVGRLWAGPYGATTYRWVAGLDDDVQRDWSLGANVGGELFLADRFSFGLELRGTYTRVASGIYTETTYADRNTTRGFSGGWTADVDGLAAFRAYFR